MKIVTLMLALLFGLLSQNSLADVARGAQLEKENCSHCHAARFNGDQTAIYLRNKRRVNSYKQLTSQVRFCENNLELTWFDNQILDVSEHLNQRYYHFTPQK
ncbi:MAG: cytochrome c [Chromatiales bacterium]|nr:cytochrome c [Chromatiales bacterium]